MLHLHYKWSGVLDYGTALQNNLNVDDTTTTFAGVLNGRYRVYVDPYAATWHHSTTLLDTKEHHHTMLVCSTAHTFHYKWFVQLGNTLSNQKSVLKLDMVSPQTHSTQEQLQFLLRVRSLSLQILTSITEELKSQTSCNQYNITSVNLRGRKTPLFFD